MPSPYSYDLQIRVVVAVEQGMEVTEASRILGCTAIPLRGDWHVKRPRGMSKPKWAISEAIRIRLPLPSSSRPSWQRTGMRP